MIAKPGRKRRFPSVVENFTASYKADNRGCWVWFRAKSTAGYGQMRIDGKAVYAHRWSYLYFLGSIREGFELDHLCRNRACVNPYHLEAVTHRENMRRSIPFLSPHKQPRGPRRPRAKQTHCIFGHAWTPENTIQIGTRGKTRCRECNRRHCRAYKERQKASQSEVALET